MNYSHKSPLSTMQPSTFADRLNICLDKEGFPPKNCGRIQLLAEMVGLTHRGASKWVNGQSTPPAKKYASLAQKLNVNEIWLKTGEGSMLGTETSTPLSTALGIPQEVVISSIKEHMSGLTDHKKTISCVLPYKGPFFGITLETEAMSPRFPNGSIIIFDESAIPKDGDFVLVQTDSFPEPIFRQLIIIGTSRYLNAQNPKFDRLSWTDDCKIVGKLVQIIISFE